MRAPPLSSHDYDVCLKLQGLVHCYTPRGSYILTLLVAFCVLIMIGNSSNLGGEGVLGIQSLVGGGLYKKKISLVLGGGDGGIRGIQNWGGGEGGNGVFKIWGGGGW